MTWPRILASLNLIDSIDLVVESLLVAFLLCTCSSIVLPGHGSILGGNLYGIFGLENGIYVFTYKIDNFYGILVII